MSRFASLRCRISASTISSASRALVVRFTENRGMSMFVLLPGMQKAPESLRTLFRLVVYQ